ncbi:MAG: cysteine desulfurase [Arachnia propionica]|nr:MAG: cysteine desulfurase [Arachnia propionica]
MSLQPAAIRQHFPLLGREVAGQPLVYLDSANTSQKPQQVVDAMAEHYLQHNANVARAMHVLGNEATQAFEDARAKVAGFIGANRPEEVVFTKNASEALNLAAYSLGQGLRPGDEVVTTVMEHHSNIVPWQLACERTGAKLRWFDITADGQLDLAAAARDGLLNERTKIVTLVGTSNVLGTRNPVTEIARTAHEVGATVVADLSQSVPHEPVDVASLGADLVAFTGHKMLGPTGIGVLWGRYDLLAELPPFLGGGEMIEIVEMAGSTYAAPPHRFEAGTPPIAQAVGLGAAVDYLTSIGMARIAAREQQLSEYLLGTLSDISGLQVLGGSDASQRASLVSFTLGDIHPHDVMQVLDSKGIAIRGGQHCARPLHVRLGLRSSNRASAYLYTTEAEIDLLADALVFTRNYFGYRS